MKEELNLEKTNSGRLEADKLTYERQVRELQGRDTNYETSLQLMTNYQTSLQLMRNQPSLSFRFKLTSPLNISVTLNLISMIRSQIILEQFFWSNIIFIANIWPGKLEEIETQVKAKQVAALAALQNKNASLEEQLENESKWVGEWVCLVNCGKIKPSWLS